MAVFTQYDGGSTAALTSALLLKDGSLNDISGITILGTPVLTASALTAVNFYDGTLSPLGIGAGLLLTSGTMPGLANTVPWFGTDNSIWPDTFYNGDADIDAVVNTVFQTQSYDATTLAFDFKALDPSATSVSFDLVFGSDEFPEWVDQFVDCAVVMVNGVNYALFNHDPMHPLSVVSSNLAAGYFQDNEHPMSLLPIEYDGVSHVLKIVAPILGGGVTNHIKIGIADTGDHIYDSGIFMANLAAGFIPGSGVVSPTTVCDDASNNVTGSAKDEYFDLKGGDDIAYAGAGDDIVVAGSGNDMVYGGSGADQMKGDAGDDFLDGGEGGDTAVFAGAWAVGAGSYGFTDLGGSYKISSAAEGADTLANVEYAKFSDGLYALSASGLSLVGSSAPVNSPGLVIISGQASFGKDLTAKVSDANGVPAADGSISYQWQVSSDGGATWIDVGFGGDTYTVSSPDVTDGDKIQVIASYIDNGSTAESVLSTPKTVQSDSDLFVTLMKLDAPVGATVVNPLTTLVQDAIELGLSPNMAVTAIKSVLAHQPTGPFAPLDINLLTYELKLVPDGAGGLQIVDPPNGDATTALTFEKIAAQIAILTSLSDDDTGINLAMKVLEAAANSQTFDLANANDLAQILGVDITGIDPQDYPQPLREIYDRNNSMAEAIADGGNINAVEKEWTDFLSIQDLIDSTSITDLSIHINQAPNGFAIAVLDPGVQYVDYTIDGTALLTGFTDPDGGLLAVGSAWADAGAANVNADGSVTIAFTAAYAGYTGPVELTYEVLDGQGGSTLASQLFVVLAAVDHEATGTLDVTGAAAEGGSLTAALTAVIDADGATTTAYQWQAFDGSIWTNLTGANAALLSIAPDQTMVGWTLHVVATTTDPLGGTTDFISAPQEVANVEDEATGTLAFGGTVAEGATISADVSGLGDVDGGITGVAYQWQLDAGTGFAAITGATAETLAIPATQSYVGWEVRLTAVTTDFYGGTTAFTSAAQKVANVEDEATGTLVIGGTVAEGATISADVSGLGDADGGVVGVAYQWQLDAGTGAGFADIAGATGATLAIPSDQSYVDLAVRLTAVTTDFYGGTTGFTSAGHTVANVNDAPTGSVTISGTVAAGETLTASNTLADADGLGTIAYQWKADGVHLADGSNYTLTPADAGKAITAEASYVDDHGYSELAASTAVGFGLTLAGSRHADTLDGSPWNDSLSGLAGNDVLDGLAGDDTLNGGAGADTMFGGDGNDTYVVDSARDRVVETTATGADAGGIDTVLSDVNWTLGDFVENLVLTGTRGIDGSGNALDNAISGNAGANMLSGGGGADRLAGGAGNDWLTGGTGNDLFVFDSPLDAKKNVDKVMDFVHGDDTIVLDALVFTSFALGPIDQATFAAYLVYDATTGALYYDADASGAGSALQFATLIGAPTIDHTNFLIGG